MSSVKPLTPKQKKLLESIKSYISEYGYPPTLKEIAGMIKENGKSTALSTAQYYVEVLTKKGYLDKESGQERGISFKRNSIQIPKLGFIAAGYPIEPIEDPQYIEVPSTISLNSLSQYYALEVIGDSMIDMGILDGDIVIIRHQLNAKDGDVVVAITENGATLKVLRQRSGKTYLEPRNNKYENIYPMQLEIRGIFEGLVRN